MASILHSLVAEENDQPISFIHGARNSDQHALADEIRTLTAGLPNIDLHIAYRNSHADDQIGLDFHSEGRVDKDLIKSHADIPEAHYLLCGPTAFMADIQDTLELAGIPLENIHTESFGPKG